ncbi:MAG TPA: hypothetical protein VGC99_18905 [Candidatus Tectomicrobia bacterium]
MLKDKNNFLDWCDKLTAISGEGGGAMATAVMRFTRGHQRGSRRSGTLDTQGGRPYIAP